MTHTIRRAVVIGSGTMGGGIAAHFANAGIPVYLLDISQQVVNASLERLRKHDLPALRKERPTACDSEGSCYRVPGG